MGMTTPWRHLTIGLASLALVPTTALGMVQLSARDGVAGVSLDVQVSGLPAATEAVVVVTTPNGGDILLPTRGNTFGEAIVTLHGSEMEQAGTYRMHLERTGQAPQADATFRVVPNGFSPSASRLQASRQTLLADGLDEVIVSVSARDRYGNPLENRPFSLAASSTDARVTPLSLQSDSFGTQRFAVSLSRSSSITLRATDLVTGSVIDEAASLSAGGIGGEEDEETWQLFTAQVASPSAIVKGFIIKDLPSQVTAGDTVQVFSVEAVDADGDRVPSYVNRIRFTSTDPLAEMPGLDDTYQFLASNQGKKDFALALKFETAGSQTLTIEDVNDPTIKGTATVTVSGGSSSSAGRAPEITAPRDASTVGGGTLTITGKASPLTNLTLTGSLTGSSSAGEDGTFSFTVTLPTEAKTATFAVIDNRDRRSRDVKITIDATAPSLTPLTTNPERPVRGTSMSLRTTVDGTDVSTVSAIVTPPQTDPATLTLTAGANKTYSTSYTPAKVGTYQVALTATDAVGNVTEATSTFDVRPERVTGVEAEPAGRLLNVTWKPVEQAQGYRIYLGKKAGDWERTLDVPATNGTPPTTVSLSDLDAGRTYALAVSAVAGATLEGDLSEAITTETLGFGLTIVPGDSQLTVSWEPTNAELPVSAYQLSFGFKGSTLAPLPLIPKASLGRDGRYTVRINDLINGVTYGLELIPMASGNPLLDLKATGEGTPNGPGKPLPGTPLDQQFYGGAPLVQQPSPPYRQPLTDSGFPGWVWAGGGAALLISLWLQWSHRRTLRRFEREG